MYIHLFLSSNLAMTSDKGLPLDLEDGELAVSGEEVDKIIKFIPHR